jgi:hypothetical protein
MDTIGVIVARLRKIAKAISPDSFLTDRDLYSIFLKYAYLYIRRQDNLNRIMKYQTVFQVLPCVELIEVDKVEACCVGIQSGCTIRRTKDKLPKVIDGAYGPLFRNVTSIDRGNSFTFTAPSIYVEMTKSKSFKFNKNKYAWYIDGYLYFPNIDWDAVLIEALFEIDLGVQDGCRNMQQTISRVPPYLYSEIENGFKQDLAVMEQLPADPMIDKQDNTRQ